MKSRKWMTGIFGLMLVMMLVSLACGIPFVGGDEDEGIPPVSEQPDAADVEAPPPAEEKPPMPPEGEVDAPPKPPEGEGDQPPPDAPGPEVETEFPLPPNVENFMDLGDAGVNFQTDMPLQKAAEFYMDTLQMQGLTERKILTVIEDSTFSMVFDGAPNGMSVVVQGVDLGESTNINIRYEDI